MPTIIFMDDTMAVIECQYVPLAGQTEEQAAAIVEGNICRPKCGIFRDAALKNQELDCKSAGKQNFKLLCLHPSSPYLAQLKKKLQETGNIKKVE